MILEYLIQNYYERAGSFKGILDSLIGSSVQAAAENEGVAAEDFLFSALGYQGILINTAKGERKLSPKQCAELQTGYYAGDCRRINSALGRPSLRLREDQCRQLHMLFGGSSRDFGKYVEKKSSVRQSLNKYVDMLYAYCMHSNDRFPFVVPGREGIVVMTVMEYLRYVRLSKKKVTAESLRECRFMPEIEYCPSASESAVIGRKLVTVEKIEDSEAEAVFSAVYRRLASQGGQTAWIGKMAPGELPFLAHRSLPQYVHLISAVTSMKMTYNEFLGGFGMRVPDLIDTFMRTGIIIHDTGEKILCTYFNVQKDEVTDLEAWDSIDYIKHVQKACGAVPHIEYSAATIENAACRDKACMKRFNMAECSRAEGKRSSGSM